MAADPIRQRLDAIERALHQTVAFDISPRGFRVRPDAATDQTICELRDAGDAAAAALDERLRDAGDPFEALLWLYALAVIGTPQARAATERFVDEIKAQGRWINETPGLRDILLFTGYAP
jgi:hypothetical protein